MKYVLYIGLCLIILGCQKQSDVPETRLLHDNWRFKSSDKTDWLTAQIPGNVFSDLLDNAEIPDPFIGTNEDSVQWVSKTDWEYQTTFQVDSKTLQKRHIELNFEGLDTYASVYLNDSLILKTANAFREFSVDVKRILKVDNTLRILFENTTKHEEAAKAHLNYTLPEGNRIFTRKGQFQYGWDWGPKLNTSGIWRPIKLVAWNTVKIQDIYIKQQNLQDSVAKLELDLSVQGDDTSGLAYHIYVNDELNSVYSAENKSIIPFEIKNPKRWWPHNLGEPYLYTIKVIVEKDDAILDSMSVKKGLRTIKLITEKDSLGESFYFEVNGKSVYAKGANYIPQNSMQNKVTDAHYNSLLNDAVEANMNMLRVWGGGIYENAIFYDLCDEKGILIWQDFMFACAMYPGDSGFLENVQQEAIDNVKRLRNHASIALWCGNNENSEGWHRWGWQDGRSETEKTEIWDNYLKVFDSMLPKTVATFTDTDYWETSPKFGRGNPQFEFQGDAHDWWVWHDGYPFEHFEEQVPRFMSEFGFQSFPSYEVINYINQNDSDSLNITSEGIKNHQKHSRGFQLIDDYMARDYPVPNNPKDYVYISQLLQAYGMTKGIEAQRRAKPYNMGTLYWQLNDCWPAISWSSIDFFGNWKALHYKGKRSFENVLISSEVEQDSLNIFLINDTFKTFSGTLSTNILNFSGEVIWGDSEEIIVKPNSSAIKQRIDLSGLSFNKNKVVIVSKFQESESLFYLVKPKDLELPAKAIQKEVIKTSDGFMITLSSKTLQKDVFLFCNESGHFSDNYFDLLPNEQKQIVFKTDAKVLNNLKIKSLNDF
ncbi:MULTISPECIES: beta-mannosidase [Bizionia]|uniref:Beta-mannosidase B n=1 Tax=Bizionia algoritergicola TaxID=291187 RepID=A0A5D0R3Q5_9FLAO|nr:MULTISPECIES: glycoside hydrolase family 2 protein [Bizionia]OBX23755.1 beta-mannosidase [Bizionia sp. APA-3]TYB75481.1 glycoside hydrolase family 2 protein [Bizionia algoritergicola]